MNETILRRRNLIDTSSGLFLDFPAWQLFILAAIAGILWAGSLFSIGFVSGQDAYWLFPKGTLPGSGADMGQILVAYLYFVQSPWQLPLFHLAMIGTPDGVNAMMMDFIPIVALVGKLIHSLTGAMVNPYGGYLFLCYALPGVMMAWVLILAGIRNALAVIIGAIFANAMPALLYRWGHMALEAHFLLIGAFALYLLSVRRPTSSVRAAWIGWLTVSYLTSINLFAMVCIVWFCGLLQRRLDGLTTTRVMIRNGAVVVGVVLIVIGLGGQFDSANSLPFAVYGHYTMNLLSPFVPQLSGLAGGVVLDPNTYQYEGFNYLGLGLLLGSIIVLPMELVWLARHLRRHAVLLVAFVFVTAFSISHRVYLGNSLLFELPMPLYLSGLLGIFRSSGRFFWLIAYAQVAMVVILAFRRPRLPVIAVCVIAAVLQLLDVQPLRQQIIASLAGPDDVELDRDKVTALVSKARSVEVIPSFQCSFTKSYDDISDGEKLESAKLGRTNMEFMLATARANIPTNTVYLSRISYGLTVNEILRTPSRAKELKQQRQVAYCAAEMARARDGHPGEVLVLLTDQPRQQDMAPGMTCTALSWARYCVRSE